MAEFNFVSTLEEAKRFAAELLDLGCFAVPEVPYPTRRYRQIDVIDEMSFDRTPGWHTFLFAKPAWGNQFFEMIFANNIHMGPVYFVSSKSGPPNIHFSYCDGVQTGQDSDLVSGFISTYSEYWTTDGSVPVPPELRSAYTALTGRIKKMSIRKKADYRTYWFTREAWSAIESRKAISPVKMDPAA